jgi:hypothetical protein
MKSSKRTSDKKVVEKLKSAPTEPFVLVAYDFTVTATVSFEVFNPRDCDTAREELSRDWISHRVRRLPAALSPVRFRGITQQ